jgi:hypothetical protein
MQLTVNRLLYSGKRFECVESLPSIVRPKASSLYCVQTKVPNITGSYRHLLSGTYHAVFLCLFVRSGTKAVWCFGVVYLLRAWASRLL